jgi:hypothetical protein
MNKKFTDNQLDKITKNLLHDFSSDNEKLNEIADSPITWQKIKREINRQKPEENKGWVEVWYRRLIAFSAFATLAVGFGIGLIWLLNSPKTQDSAKIESSIIEVEKVAEPQVDKPIVDNSVETASIQVNKSSVSVPRKVAAKTKIETPQIIQTKTAITKTEPKIVAVKQAKVNPKQSPKAVEVTSANNEEVKTEFISLSYLPAPESGQIVRVKVPRAMMVSLGVSNNVSKNAEMVSAEVILGDDGSSRAIRFISTNNK